jgi:regulator of replication initiation timing
MNNFYNKPINPVMVDMNKLQQDLQIVLDKVSEEWENLYLENENLKQENNELKKKLSWSYSVTADDTNEVLDWPKLHESIIKKYEIEFIKDNPYI